MDTKYLKRLIGRAMHISITLAILLSISTVVYAATPSPFVGHWQAIDVDGSDILLTIAGPPGGSYKITWTESYFSFCDGEAGIVRGTGWLDEANPYILEADLHLECFTTGDSTDFHMTWKYHPTTNKLSSKIESGFWSGHIIIWSRPGGLPEPPPALDLRVNYGHDWVESFYEGGHVAWVTVTDKEGAFKATVELDTEPKDYWGGETGFQSLDEVWTDVDGNPMDYPPDILPEDWVYGWVDNGASAQVQIGEISGTIDLNADSIEGTVNAPWFSDQEMEVEVECLPWGAPKPIDNVTYGMVMPDDTVPYACSWSGEWNILPYQDVGVGYLGSDGHWVANAISTSVPQIIASESGNWFWTTGFNPVTLYLFIFEYEVDGVGVNQLWEDQRVADEGGFVIVDDHGLDLVQGNYVVVSDGTYQKGLKLLETTVTVFDTINEVMAGVAPAGSEVWAAAGPQEWQERIFVEADPVSGVWLAEFASIGFNITEDMRPWSFSHIYDGDGDANEGSTPPTPQIRAWLGSQRVEGYQWPLDAWIALYINEVFIDSQQVQGDENWTSVEFDLNEWVLEPGQEITMIGGGTEKNHTILPVSITSVNTELNIVEGTASGTEMIFLCIYEGGCDPPAEIYEFDQFGNWSMVYGDDFEILPGYGMDATESDNDGDGTSFDYWVPLPD